MTLTAATAVITPRVDFWAACPVCLVAEAVTVPVIPAVMVRTAHLPRSTGDITGITANITMATTEAIMADIIAGIMADTTADITEVGNYCDGLIFALRTALTWFLAAFWGLFWNEEIGRRILALHSAIGGH